MNKLNDDIIHIKKIYNIEDGVAAGDVHAGTNLRKCTNINIPNHINTNLDKHNITNDTIKLNKLNVCNVCGTEWNIEHVKKNKLIWCQVCSISHIFTPTNVLLFDFKTDEEINNYKNDLLTLYEQGKDYWIN